MHPCPLCHSTHVEPHARAHGRHFLACAGCGLVFVPPVFHPDRQTERRRYETHNNDPSDARYRAFLRRAETPLVKRIDPPADGLDYGAGPGPTMSVMLEERGFDVALYDPFFARDPETLNRTYDFITCTETAEHFHVPRQDFERLHLLLRPGGWLVIMTEWADDMDFRRWSYARDVTHVCFYRRETMGWIADRFNYALELPRSNVALFRRPVKS